MTMTRYDCVDSLCRLATKSYVSKYESTLPLFAGMGSIILCQSGVLCKLQR